MFASGPEGIEPCVEEDTITCPEVVVAHALVRASRARSRSLSVACLHAIAAGESQQGIDAFRQRVQLSELMVDVAVIVADAVTESAESFECHGQVNGECPFSQVLQGVRATAGIVYNNGRQLGEQ
jgi:hypothetical protein